MSNVVSAKSCSVQKLKLGLQHSFLTEDLLTFGAGNSLSWEAMRGCGMVSASRVSASQMPVHPPSQGDLEMSSTLPTAPPLRQRRPGAVASLLGSNPSSAIYPLCGLFSSHGEWTLLLED